MAAKDKESLQQFPLVKTAMLTDQELQEQVKLSTKSLSDSGVSEDPHSQAARYLQQHRIVEVFQNILSRIAYHKPEDPLQFMLDEIEKFRAGQKLEEL